MSVLFRGMEMPTRCEDCPLENCDEDYYGDEFNHRCSLIYKGYTHNNRYEKRRDDCPLVPVPPHGRLIDADALMQIIKDHDYLLTAHFNSQDYGMFTIGIQQAVDEAPTVIPAEEGK